MIAFKLMLLSGILLLMLACEQEKKLKVTRWYTQWQLNLGMQVYKSNCIKCHGETGNGTIDKPEDKATAFYPAPALNDRSDSLQRPISELIDIVNFGGSKTDGKMPMFRDELSASETISVIAYFQNFWSDKDYSQWLEWGGLN